MAVFQSPFRFFAVSGDIFADRAATIGCAKLFLTVIIVSDANGRQSIFKTSPAENGVGKLRQFPEKNSENSSLRLKSRLKPDLSPK